MKIIHESAFIAVMAALACGSTRAESAESLHGVDEARLIAKAKTAFVAHMLSPETVEFRNTYLRPVPSWLLKENEAFSPTVLCGEFNAKNHDGNYNGFLRFIVDTEFGSSTFFFEPALKISDEEIEKSISDCRSARDKKSMSKADLDIAIKYCELSNMKIDVGIKEADFKLFYSILCEEE